METKTAAVLLLLLFRGPKAWFDTNYKTGFGNLTLLLIICTDMFYYSSKEFKWVKVAALAKLWLVVQETGAAQRPKVALKCQKIFRSFQIWFFS